MDDLPEQQLCWLNVGISAVYECVRPRENITNELEKARRTGLNITG